MTFHAFPIRIRSKRSTVEFADLYLVSSNDDKNKAIEEVSEKLDLDIYGKIVVVDSTTYVSTEHSI